MKIIFYTNTLNFRGTTVATSDYARYNREILGNESIVAYDRTLEYGKGWGTESSVVSELSKEFPVFGCDQIELERLIENESADFAYFMRAGRAEHLPSGCRTGVHAVFQCYEPHGNRYAYISEWLSRRMTAGAFPFVPYIVDLPNPTGDYRELLGIKKGQTVIGRHGGFGTFDIPWVKQTVLELANKSDRFVFLFLGTEPFVSHPNVKFFSEVHSPQIKANFIQTCDAMLHARSGGESFGLAIAEFLFLNKPVLAWQGGTDLNHTEMLAGFNTLYESPDDLMFKLNSIGDFRFEFAKRVEDYRPSKVMKIFENVFLRI
jgi:hypothetical protein